MPSKKHRARERRAASRPHTRVDATNMPEATRVYIAVGELIPELADFTVQTTHGEVQAAIAAAREQLAAGDDPAVVASVRDSLTRYPRSTLVEWATSASPPDEWGDWCTDVLLAVAYKHACDGEPIMMCRPGRELADSMLASGYSPEA
jgi:acetyl-CoA acetyltransferase